MKGRILSFAVSAVVAISLSSVGQAREPADGFYQQKDQGWFWGKLELPSTDEADLLPPDHTIPQLVPAESETVNSAALPVSQLQGPRPFSPAWLRTKLPEYRDRALADPSPDNVRAYYYVQRYSLDMAERFALAAQKVVLADPFLDENSRRPLSAFGAQVFDEQARAASDALARRLSAEVRFVYFYRSDCPYCEAQNPILANLQRKWNIPILPIALDGRPLPDGHFPDFVPNQGYAQFLSVQATPTIYMARPPHDFVLLAEGLVAENSLRQRMILAAHEAGWISDAEFNATRAVKPIQIQADLGDLPEQVLNDPRQLVDLLRTKIANAAAGPIGYSAKDSL